MPSRAPAHAVAAGERLHALDVFRGATIAAMLVVNNPGTWGAVYPPLLHFFLFIVGVTTHLSLAARRARGDADGQLVRQILRRGGLIFLWGFVLSAFPFFATGSVPGFAAPSILAAHLDRWILGLDHVWAGSRTFDPEGPLSTIPAVATAMLGVLAGRWLGSGKPLGERIEGLFAAGFVATALGAAWGWSFPINKNLWTSSYALFTAGAAAAAIAACLWVIDRMQVRWWTRPLEVFGVNPLVAFVGSGLLARPSSSRSRSPACGSWCSGCSTGSGSSSGCEPRRPGRDADLADALARRGGAP